MAATRTLTQQILQQTGSLNNENFDYVETAENTSSLSTPSTTSLKESPFAQDSLGDTVIHLDQVGVASNFAPVLEFMFPRDRHILSCKEFIYIDRILSHYEVV